MRVRFQLGLSMINTLVTCIFGARATVQAHCGCSQLSPSAVNHFCRLLQAEVVQVAWVSVRDGSSWSEVLPWGLHVA